MTYHYAPYLNTPAGACLTLTNWQALQVQYAVCDFAQIMIKPELAYWQQGRHLKTYLAWPDTVILDAHAMQLNARDEFVIQSPYDGTRVTLTVPQFWDLVALLNPDHLLAPSVLETSPQFHVPDLQKWQYAAQDGIVLNYQQHLIFISDKPAKDALQGIVYADPTLLCLNDTQYEHDFQPISSDCPCPSCHQQYSRAYFHHLLQATPLLCQRLLMMHNVFALSRYLNLFPMQAISDPFTRDLG